MLRTKRYPIFRFIVFGGMSGVTFWLLENFGIGATHAAVITISAILGGLSFVVEEELQAASKKDTNEG